MPDPASDSGATSRLPELEHSPAPKLLDIDWANVTLANDAEALELWKRIAPTGADWEPKLEEIPEDLPIAHGLALALLHEGNFTCSPIGPGPRWSEPANAGERGQVDHNACTQGLPADIDPPSASAGLADPCLRRLLALWALAQLEQPDLPQVHDALRAIAAIPPPESELVAAAFRAIPETDLDGRFELLAIAWRSGQTDLVNGSLGSLDEPHLIDAVIKLHIDGALQVLSAQGARATYLAAAIDEQMAGAARMQVIDDLVATDDKLAPDVRSMLVSDTRSGDCDVAALAARMLALHGARQFLPKRSAQKPIRAMCVLASFERLQRNDEASLLGAFVPARGLELVKVSYDALSEADPDGDGDPHTARETNLVPRVEAVLPEIDDLVRALRHCTGSVCRSDDREFHFTFKGGYLARLEVVERPPCRRP